METVATQLDMIHEHLVSDFVVDKLGLSELMGTCFLNGIDDEGAADASGGFVQIGIMPQHFLENLGTGSDNGRGIARDG